MMQWKRKFRMNIWTQLSLELASQRNYLDQLFRVYPMAPEVVREIDQTKWTAVEEAFNLKNNASLVHNLLDLELFPIKDSYVAYFRRDRSAVDRNPETVNRLAGRMYELGLDELFDRASQPKETNRQIGPLFKQWVEKGALGVPVLQSVDEFNKKKENCILNVSDSAMKSFARDNLGYVGDKGLDFLAKFNGKYVIGEAKFITDFGGHQDRQFDDALGLASTILEDVVTVAILDGVLYIPSAGRMHREITNSKNRNVMSSLVLRDFLFQI